MKKAGLRQEMSESLVKFGKTEIPKFLEEWLPKNRNSGSLVRITYVENGVTKRHNVRVEKIAGRSVDGTAIIVGTSTSRPTEYKIEDIEGIQIF